MVVEQRTQISVASVVTLSTKARVGMTSQSASVLLVRARLGFEIYVAA